MIELITNPNLSFYIYPSRKSSTACFNEISPSPNFALTLTIQFILYNEQR